MKRYISFRIVYQMDKADELFERFSKELEIDTQVDSTNVLEKQFKLPNIRHKWMYRLRQCQKNLFTLEKARDTFIDQSIQNSAIELSKVKVSRKVEADPKYKQITEEINDYQTLIHYLDQNINRNLTSMGYDIKNIVELMKMEMM